MFRKLMKSVPPPPVADNYSSITTGLFELYKAYMLQLERDFKFPQFYSPILTEGDFMAKPMILLLGQYSTGKTTFVRHVLETEYPGLRIGPEPTTDKFVAVCHADRIAAVNYDGEDAQPNVLPGHAAVVDRSLAWSQLEKFGPGFLTRFEVVHVNSMAFTGVTLIDTPGVLAGNKQWERGYDFEGVIKWFAERVDLVLLFFDAHKLDISDEFRRCIQALKGNDSKVCILLNKADSVSAQQLMRVYGALMWSLGKVMPAPEVPKIHIGSFWDQPLQHEDSRKLFDAESEDLFRLIYSLPSRSAARKVDDFLKRARLCRVHCALMEYMRRQMPYLGRASKQKELLQNLGDVYKAVAKQFDLSLSDFPPEDEMRAKVMSIGELHKFPKLDMKRMKALDTMLQTKVANLTKLIPREEAMAFKTTSRNHMNSPFTMDTGAGTSSSASTEQHQHLRQPTSTASVSVPDVSLYLNDFEAIGPNPVNGLVSGAQVKPHFERTLLSNNILHKIWNLADLSRDGYLDIYEYSLARQLIDMSLNGMELPDTLPPHLHSHHHHHHHAVKNVNNQSSPDSLMSSVPRRDSTLPDVVPPEFHQTTSVATANSRNLVDDEREDDQLSVSDTDSAELATRILKSIEPHTNMSDVFGDSVS